MRATSYLLAAVLIYSCAEKPSNTIPERSNQDNSNEIVCSTEKHSFNYDSLIHLSFSGDTLAYIELSAELFKSSRFEEALYYSLAVANEFDNSYASYNVYASFLCLTSLSEEKWLRQVNKKTRNLALYYLVSAAEKKYPSAVSHLKEVESILGESLDSSQLIEFNCDN
jgi:hypothetical protein